MNRTVSSPSRRSFVLALSATAALAATRSGWGAPSLLPQVGVQLYTLRAELAADLKGTLAGVSKIGITQVESFPALYERPAADLKKMFEDYGLQCPSGHFDYLKLEEGLDYGKALGLTYIVCSALPGPLRNPSGFAMAAERFNVLGAKARDMGMRFAFHNHNFEFLAFPTPPSSAAGPTPPMRPENGLSLLLQKSDPALVSWEEDCYWVAQSGNDPLVLLNEYKDRVRLLHLKDRQRDAPVTFVQGKQSQFFTEVGTGTISWPPILSVARQINALLFIEQDVTAMPPLESLAISYRNIQNYLAGTKVEPSKDNRTKG
jgi:sugar phosphate isomerase/epimerase